MIKFFAVVLVFICSIFLLENVHCQTEDVGLWTGVSIGKDVSKRISASLEVQSRFFENISMVDKHLVESGIEFNADNNLKIGFGYRFMLSNDVEGFVPEQRYQADLGYKVNIERFKLNVRSRVQYGNVDFIKNEDALLQNLVNRNKLEIGYDIYKSPIEPFVATECYFDINDDIPWLYSKLRTVVGATVNVTNYGEVEIFYMHEKEQNTNNPALSHVFGVGFKIDI